MVDRVALYPFLRELSEQGRRAFGALAATRVPAGTGLLRPGDEPHGVYLVLEGALRVYYLADDGGEATLYHVEPGSTCVLALSATLRAQPYPAWVQATSKGALLVRVPEGAFQRLLDEEPGFRAFVLGSLSERIFELMRSLKQLATASVEQRVGSFLLERMKGCSQLLITQAAIAAELGTAREVVSRALRSLAKRGLLRTERGRVRILDREGLAKVERSRERA